MKFAVSVLSVLVLATGLSAYRLPATGSGELAKDLQDFLDLIPLKKASKLVIAYLARDKEFQAAIEVLYSKELYNFMMDVEAAPEYAEMISFMQKAGLDAYYLLKQLNELLASQRLHATDSADTQISGGLVGFAADFGSLVSTEKGQVLLDEKVAAGGAFTEYYNLLMSQRFLEFYKKALNNVHYQILVRDAELKNIDAVAFQQLFSILTVLRAVIA
ncbi:protein G12 [Megalopta genalis]|uniref:protein G12 n=1 Tax=Megalopta genalis TaxID=115081 RepID=UPI003FD6A9FB